MARTIRQIKGALTIEKLEAMTCVCSVGLDMIAIPGKTPASTISGIIADEAAIVAAIIAAISAHTGTAPEGFRVVSFKKRK